MKHISSVYFILALVFLTACQEQQEIPMWEGIEKSSTMLEADKKFIKTTLEAGTREEAAKHIMARGWEAINEGDLNKAIRRFNQVWLLLPDYADAHYGFAIATHLQGKPLEVVERHFDRAEQGGKGDDPDFHADHGRVLYSREMNEEALPHFEKAIEMDPANETAIQGMWRVSAALGDEDTAARYKRIFDAMMNAKQSSGSEGGDTADN